MSYDIVFAGIGGQGVVSAVRILAEAALKEGLEVVAMENRGHAKRHGSVNCHVRIGKTHSPEISSEKADLFISFDAVEAMRYLNLAKQGGTLLVDKNFSKGYFHEIDLLLMKKKLKIYNLQNGSDLPTNSFFLGAASGLDSFPVSEETLKKAIKEFSPKKAETNLKAFELGLKEMKRTH